MKQFLFLILIFFEIPAYCQTKMQKEIISINVELVSKRDSCIYLTGNYNCYLSRFEIINNEDTTVIVKIWNCSWDMNWKSDVAGIFLPGYPCNRNFPELVEIPTNKSLVFYGDIVVNPKVANSKVRFGFRNCKRSFAMKDISKDFFDLEEKTYWSDPISINSRSFYYDFFIK